ncbi:hypothetical protein EDD22DRAFT_1010729 [Suillus occidentalis]|nr:hypothetical protein EDD22DRAFT_1010729 [Suillus occidentalis]
MVKHSSVAFKISRRLSSTPSNLSAVWNWWQSSREILFCVLPILTIRLCINWQDPNLPSAAADSDVTASPLTVVFQRAGFGAAAHVINAVPLTAVLSATNSLSFEMMKAGVGWALGGELCSLTQLNVFIDCSILVARSQDIPSSVR